jgi:hypothetical protein
MHRLAKKKKKKKKRERRRSRVWQNTKIGKNAFLCSMTGSKIVAVAEAEIGQGETPINSNRTKYGRWFGLDGVPWCGVFVSWCCAKAGAPLPALGYSKGFAGCQTAVARLRKLGLMTDDPQPGDLVFFDWNRDGRHDHTGIFVKRLPRNKFESIEGNTSFVNDSNGGTVMRRTRDFSTAIFFSRP